jgi:hypothetical protein
LGQLGKKKKNNYAENADKLGSDAEREKFLELVSTQEGK